MGLFSRLGALLSTSTSGTLGGLKSRIEPRQNRGGTQDHDEYQPVQPPLIWTWPNVQSMIAEHERAMFFKSAQLADSLMRDDEIAGLIQTRLLARNGLPFRLEEEDQQLLEEFPTLFPENAQSEVLFWTIHEGFCVGELRNWKTGTPTLYPWHPSHCVWDDSIKRFKVNTKEHGPQIVEPGDGKWVLFTSWLDRQPWMAGIIRAVGLLLVIRQATLADWARNSKVHGSASKVLKAKAEISEIEDVQKAIQALRKMVNDSTIVLPDNCDLFLLEPKVSSWQVFKELRIAVEEALCILYLGQNLTTKVKGGSFAAAKVHERVRQDYLEGDCRILIPTTHKQVIFPYLQRKRGIQQLRQAPQAIWDATPPEDVVRAADVRAKNAQAMNLAAQAYGTFRKNGLNVEPVAYGAIFAIPLVEGKPTLPTPDPPKDGETPPGGPRDDRPGKGGKERTALARYGQRELLGTAPAPLPTLLRWGRDPFIGGQLATDRVGEGAAVDAVDVIGQEVMAMILEEIKACREEADPYGALKVRLTALLPSMDPTRMMWILNDAMSLAVGVGTYSARQEGQGDGGGA